MNFEDRMNEFMDSQRQKFEESLREMAKPRPEQLGRIPRVQANKYSCPECGATGLHWMTPAPHPACRSAWFFGLERQVSQTGPWKFGESGK